MRPPHTSRSGDAKGPSVEALLQMLVAPYLRVPLIVSFFASDDRVHSLGWQLDPPTSVVDLTEQGEHQRARVVHVHAAGARGDDVRAVSVAHRLVAVVRARRDLATLNRADRKY